MSRTAAIVLVLLPLCFTGRALLTGKVYAPIDLPFMSEPLNAYAAEFGVPKVHNGTLSDLYCQIIPWRSAVRTAIANGQWPLLNPFMLCGDILAAAAQPAPYDPFNLIGMLIPLPPSLTFAAAMTFFLAGFGAFVFARALGCGELAALVAAAGWMFSGNVAFFVGWPLARSWAYLPLIFFAVRSVVREASVRGGVILMIALTLLILSGHPESLLHVTAVGAAYGLFEIATTRKRIGRVIAIACASGIVALLLTAIFLLPFLEASQQTLETHTRLSLPCDAVAVHAGADSAPRREHDFSVLGRSAVARLVHAGVRSADGAHRQHRSVTGHCGAVRGEAAEGDVVLLRPGARQSLCSIRRTTSEQYSAQAAAVQHGVERAAGVCGVVRAVDSCGAGGRRPGKRGRRLSRTKGRHRARGRRPRSQDEWRFGAGSSAFRSHSARTQRGRKSASIRM